LDPFKIGDVIAGKYEITRLLGQGGMGVVVAARHRELGDLVALKFLRPSYGEKAESYARFAREARTANRIKNEHVARVFDAGIADGVPFMVMEYLTGEDLAATSPTRAPFWMGRSPASAMI
jgi:eukaryotic-like serine/threonine-protein kinase